MKHFLISKYDPARRAKNNGYLGIENEWTEACELGRTFNGKLFTAKEYFEIENKYIKSILFFFDASGLDYLRMTSPISTHYTQDQQYHDAKNGFPQLYELEFEKVSFTDDRKIYRDELITLIKMNLRQFAYCCLSILDKFYLNFGDDSYVYIETYVPPERIDSEAGIYIEETNEAGPYMPRGTIEVQISSSRIGQEEGADLNILANVPRLKIRDLLGYSHEHPFVTHMPITSEIAKKLETLTEYVFDFDRFEYHISTYGDEF